MANSSVKSVVAEGKKRLQAMLLELPKKGGKLDDITKRLAAAEKKLDDDTAKKLYPLRVKTLKARLESAVEPECYKSDPATAEKTTLKPFEEDLEQLADAVQKAADTRKNVDDLAGKIRDSLKKQLEDSPKLKASFEARIKAAETPAENGETKALEDLNKLKLLVDKCLETTDEAASLRTTLEQRGGAGVPRQQGGEGVDRRAQCFREKHAALGRRDLRQAAPHRAEQHGLQSHRHAAQGGQETGRKEEFCPGQRGPCRSPQGRRRFVANPLNSATTARRQLAKVENRWAGDVAAFIHKLNGLCETISEELKADGVKDDVIASTLAPVRKLAGLFDAKISSPSWPRWARSSPSRPPRFARKCPSGARRRSSACGTSSATSRRWKTTRCSSSWRSTIRSSGRPSRTSARPSSIVCVIWNSISSGPDPPPRRREPRQSFPQESANMDKDKTEWLKKLSGKSIAFASREEQLQRKDAILSQLQQRIRKESQKLYDDMNLLARKRNKDGSFSEPEKTKEGKIKLDPKKEQRLLNYWLRDQTTEFDIDDQQEGFTLTDEDTAKHLEGARLVTELSKMLDEEVDALDENGKPIMEFEYENELDGKGQPILEVDLNGNPVIDKESGLRNSSAKKVIDDKTNQPKLKPKKVKLFSDEELSQSFYQPLVRQGLLPETFVPDKYSETKKMIDGSFKGYAERLKKEGLKNKIFNKDNFKTVLTFVSAGASIVGSAAEFMEAGNVKPDDLKDGILGGPSHIDKMKDKETSTIMDTASTMWEIVATGAEGGLDIDEKVGEVKDDNKEQSKEDLKEKQEAAKRVKMAGRLAELMVASVGAEISKAISSIDPQLSGLAVSLAGAFNATVKSPTVAVKLAKTPLTNDEVNEALKLLGEGLTKAFEECDPDVGDSKEKLKQAGKSLASGLVSGVNVAEFVKDIKSSKYDKVLASVASAVGDAAGKLAKDKPFVELLTKNAAGISAKAEAKVADDFLAEEDKASKESEKELEELKKAKDDGPEKGEAARETDRQVEFAIPRNPQVVHHAPRPGDRGCLEVLRAAGHRRLGHEARPEHPRGRQADDRLRQFRQLAERHVPRREPLFGPRGELHRQRGSPGPALRGLRRDRAGESDRRDRRDRRHGLRYRRRRGGGRLEDDAGPPPPPRRRRVGALRAQEALRHGKGLGDL